MSRPLVLVVAAAIAAPAAAASRDEVGLRAADAAQLVVARAHDADALSALMHPAFMANSPEGSVLSRDQVLVLWRSRSIRRDPFDRIVKEVRLAGNVGIVMGTEFVRPSAGGSAGKRRPYGSQTFERHFTNVWLWQDGRWLFLARHANEHAWSTVY